MNDRIREVLGQILERFKAGDIPEALAYSVFPLADVPSAKWSLLNRLLMVIAGTRDARGFKQWREAGRHVVKGAKAFHILVPSLKKVLDEETGEEKEILKGFIARPVFRYEDTDGEALSCLDLALPELPLVEVARSWGISVKAVPGNYSAYGYYSPSGREIALATREECVFFHELAHCAHEKLNGSLKAGQDPFQEIIAELAAQALCRMVGKQPGDTLGNSYQYIESYAARLELSPYAACIRVLEDTEKVINLILHQEAGKAEATKEG